MTSKLKCSSNALIYNECTSKNIEPQQLKIGFVPDSHNLAWHDQFASEWGRAERRFHQAQRKYTAIKPNIIALCLLYRSGLQHKAICSGLSAHNSLAGTFLLVTTIKPYQTYVWTTFYRSTRCSKNYWREPTFSRTYNVVHLLHEDSQTLNFPRQTVLQCNNCS